MRLSSADDASGAQSSKVATRKPSLPPIFYVAMFLWLTSAILLKNWDACKEIAWCVGAVLLLAGVAISRKSSQSAIALQSSMAGIVIGIAVVSAYSFSYEFVQRTYLDSKTHTMELIALQDSKPGQFTTTCEMKLWSLDGASVRSDVVVLVTLDSNAEVLANEIITAVGVFEAFQEHKAHSSFSGGMHVRLALDEFEMKHVPIISVITDVRRHIIRSISHVSGTSEGAQLYQAMVCGYRSELRTSDLYLAFTRVGLAHLIAVSGTHLTIVVAFIAYLLHALSIRKRTTIALTSFVLVGYLFFTGMPISVVRALMMVLSSLFAFLVGRRPAALNALSCCIFVLVLLNPPTALDISFILSATSVLGIVLFAPLFTSLLPETNTKMRSILELVAVTLAANVLSGSFGVAYFSQFSLLSPLANVLFSVLFAVIMLVGFVCIVIVVILGPGSVLLLSVPTFMFQAFAQGVSLLARVPYAAVPASIAEITAVGISAGLGIALYLGWSRVRLRFIGAGVLVLLLFFAGNAIQNHFKTEIIMLDVGQGDAIVIRSEGYVMLVDTGNQDWALRAALGRHGIYRIDALLITHSDDDHCGSVDALQSVCEIRQVLVAKDALHCECYRCTLLHDALYRGRIEEVIGVEVGDLLSFGKLRATILWPHRYNSEGGNSDSICFLLDYDENSDGVAEQHALFTGDAEAEELEAIMKQTNMPPINLLKVGHHGSAKSLSDAVIQRLDIQCAFISVGEHNRYGHPTQEVLSLLEKEGSDIHRTDLEGDLIYRFALQ